VLVLTIPALGWSTYADSMRRALSDEPDVDIAHAILSAPLPQKALGRRYPGERGWVHNSVRRRLLWRLHLPGVRRAIRAGRFDAIHASSQHAGLLMLDAQAATGIRFSLGVDSTVVLDQECAWPAAGPRALELLERYDRRSLAAAAFVAPMSEWAARSLRDDYGVRSTIVAPPSIDVRASTVREVRRPGPPRIVFIGNDWHRKGGDRLVAWHQEHLRDTELHVVSGAAPALTGLRGVIRHGAVPREAVIGELLPDMDVLALPTTADMSPWVLVEAAAAGLPCVTSRLGGIPELVLDGETGILCDAHDDGAFVRALRALADDPVTAGAYGRAARALALERFDAHTSYRPIIDRLLAG